MPMKELQTQVKPINEEESFLQKIACTAVKTMNVKINQFLRNPHIHQHLYLKLFVVLAFYQ